MYINHQNRVLLRVIPLLLIVIILTRSRIGVMGVRGIYKSEACCRNLIGSIILIVFREQCVENYLGFWWGYIWMFILLVDVIRLLGNGYLQQKRKYLKKKCYLFLESQCFRQLSFSKKKFIIQFIHKYLSLTKGSLLLNFTLIIIYQVIFYLMRTSSSTVNI